LFEAARLRAFDVIVDKGVRKRELVIVEDVESSILFK
jgi:hypothetical protein